MHMLTSARVVRFKAIVKSRQVKSSQDNARRLAPRPLQSNSKSKLSESDGETVTVAVNVKGGGSNEHRNVRVDFASAEVRRATS